MMNRRDVDDYTHERLGMIDDQLRRIQNTLRELVNFSRPATNEATLSNVHEALDAALSIAKYYKRRKGKQIVTRYEDRLPRVMVVRDQLVQVFLNLILNAMDATEEGGTIEIATRQSDRWLLVSVSDEGHGIPLEQQPRLFRPYFTTKETGTGLGLFVCRRVIEQSCGGRIELTDSSPDGTTFTVALPLSRDTNASPPPTSRTAADAGDPSPAGETLDQADSAVPVSSSDN